MEANESNEKPSPKQRKVSQGPIREKARTMKKLVNSVGKVLKRKGYPGLTIANIAAEAKVDRKLIYVYFGTIDNLIETYIREKDFWKSDSNDFVQHLFSNPDILTKKVLTELLHQQFGNMLNNLELQKIIHWEIGGKNEILRKIADEREAMGEQLFDFMEANYTNPASDIRAVLALQVSGIYYLSLHAKNNGSNFCGIDINTPEGEQRIYKALEQIVDFSYNPIPKTEETKKVRE